MILPIEKQITCLELSRELKENGYEQEGYFWWGHRYYDETWHLMNLDSPNLLKVLTDSGYVAPTVAELMEVFKEKNIHLKILILPNLYHIYGQNFEGNTRDGNLCNALVKMWLYLKKNKLI